MLNDCGELIVMKIFIMSIVIIAILLLAIKILIKGVMELIKIRKDLINKK